MNCRQSWLLSRLSEKSCRRCMYRYARATRTLRAAATLLALHAVELAVPCISNLHTGLVFLFDVRAVSSSWRISPSPRVPSFRFVAASSAVCFCLRAVRHRCARRSACGTACGPAASISHKSSWQVGTVCRRDCLRPARYRLSLQKPVF